MDIKGKMTELIQPELTTEDKDFDRALRPKRLEDFVGQKKTVDQLRIFIEATSSSQQLSSTVLQPSISLVAHNPTILPLQHQAIKLDGSINHLQFLHQILGQLPYKKKLDPVVFLCVPIVEKIWI